MKEDRNATIALLTKVFSSPAVRPDEEPFDIDLLAEKASSGNQSLRFDAFQEFEAMEIDEQEGWPLWQQIVPVHIQHIEDANYKVAARCMKSLGRIAEAFKEQLEPSLVLILHSVMTVLSKADNKVHKAAEALIQTLQKTYETELII